MICKSFAAKGTGFLVSGPSGEEERRKHSIIHMPAF